MYDLDICIRVNLRQCVLITMVMISAVMLWWMYTEQDKIHQCRNMAGKEQQGDKIQVMAENQIRNQSGRNGIQTEKIEDLERIEGVTKWNYNWDSKQWKNQSEAIGVPARTLILVRHGQYDFKTGLLNDMGKKQADLTGQRLKEMGTKFSRMIHSNMPRAKETAEIINKYLTNVPIETDNMLEEGGPIPPDPTISYWGLPARMYHVDGPRLESTFRKYFYRADKGQKQQSFELLVGHSNSFRFFILRALQLNPRGWMRLFLPHGSITLLHINSDSTVSMTRCGDSGYMPHHMVTF